MKREPYFMDNWYIGDGNLKNLGSSLCTSKCLYFESLKPLRMFIKTFTKKVQSVSFIDDIDFDIE